MEGTSLSYPSLQKRLVRIVPIVFFLYLVNFLDRVNISYAINAGMFNDLGVHGGQASIVASLASALFFVGYFIPQVFSNLGITRAGIRRVFIVAFTAWGLLTIATGFVNSVGQVYLLRFLLGVAEGPFYAGVILYLSLWFLGAERATANSMFNAAIPVSGIIGGLIAGTVFSVYGDDPGWRYLFYYEGALAIFAAILVYLLMSDFPETAKWLTEEEKKAMKSRKEMEEANHEKIKWTRALVQVDVMLLALTYFLGVTSLYGYSIWLPSIIKSFEGVSPAESSFLSTIPYLIASLSLILIARHADRSGAHRKVTSLVFITAALGLFLSAALVGNPVVSFLFFSVAAIGIYSFLSPFWAVPSKFLSGEARAASIGIINAVGNLGGIAGPIVVGYIKAMTGSFVDGVYSMAIFSLLAGVVIMTIRRAK